MRCSLCITSKAEFMEDIILVQNQKKKWMMKNIILQGQIDQSKCNMITFNDMDTSFYAFIVSFYFRRADMSYSVYMEQELRKWESISVMKKARELGCKNLFLIYKSRYIEIRANSIPPVAVFLSEFASGSQTNITIRCHQRRKFVPVIYLSAHCVGLNLFIACKSAIDSYILMRSAIHTSHFCLQVLQVGPNTRVTEEEAEEEEEEEAEEEEEVGPNTCVTEEA
ncbi:hypothetical protein Ahy_A02g005015 isoform A [Arachis hypogaea]|uniref:Uncharacterized protein n=1 Tax=Arachis hypogaea TaxID=3818 RepID=A0A445E5G5_ARAHY|nr:hypothetical protein Ahy_A02g005015 isoform A [Arachis hypogaea]